jgi:hypothetical protein
MSSLKDIRYDNYTMYGIKSETERHILVCYTALITISSVIGDTLILIGSLKFKAIKLHDTIVAFIQHIAIADLVLSISKALPGSVSLAANKWILGKFLCYVVYYGSYIPALALCLLISAIALAKVLIINYPLRAVHFSKKASHLIAAGIWVYSAIFPLAATIKEKFDIYFSYLDYNCESFGEWKPVENLIYCIAVGFSIFTSNVITVVCSVLLIVAAKRATERGLGELRWQGIMAVLITVAVHTAASLPFGIYFVGCQLAEDDPNNFFHVTLYRYALYIALLDTVANFYIYSLTLSSFREFLRSIVQALATNFVRCSAGVQDETTRATESFDQQYLIT